MTCAQQGVPTSSGASADKCRISSQTELKQITPEQSPVNLLNIPQVIYFLCRGEGGRKQGKLVNHHYVINKERVGITRLTASVQAEPIRALRKVLLVCRAVKMAAT